MEEILKLGESKVVIIAWILESLKITDSPSLKVLSFLYIKTICDEVNFSATMPIVFPFSLKISSPIIKSDVVFVGPLIYERTIFGAEGFAVSADSKIPWSSIISGVFNEIFWSSTLVPKA